MKKIPEWLYPLYEKSDKQVYDFLIKLGTGRFKIEIIGTKKEVCEFIKLLIVKQKMKKYRIFRDIVLQDMKDKKIINAPNLIKQGAKSKISKGIDKSWAIFKQDQRLCLLTHLTH